MKNDFWLILGIILVAGILGGGWHYLESLPGSIF